MNLSLSNRAKATLIAASAALAALPAIVNAFPSPQWMQGGHSARITGVACSPDGTMIASSSEDGTVKIWSTNGALLKTLSPLNCPITAMAWSPDGTKIAGGSYIPSVSSSSGAGKGLTYLWQAPSGWTASDVSMTRISTNRFGRISALAFTADSASLACGNNGGSNLVYSANSPFGLVTSRPAYNSRPSGVTSVAFTSSGLMGSGCEDGSVRVYDSSWNLLWNSMTNAATHTTNVTAVAFSPDGSLIASASMDRTIQIWSASTGALQRTLTGHTNDVTSVAFSPNGQRIVTGGSDGTIKVWNSSSGACLVTIAAHALPVNATVFSPDGSCVVSGSDDCTVRIWSAADGSALGTLGGQNSFIGAVVVSPDGTLCASVGGDETVNVRNMTDGSLVCGLAGNTNYVSCLAFSPDSGRLATGGGVLDPTIKIWRISDGALLQTIPATTNGVMALGWSSDGTILASGGDSTEQCIRLWNVSDGALLHTLAGHSGGVTALAFSPGGGLLASGGRRFDNVIKIWSVTNGSLVRTLSGHTNNIEAVAFASDGDTVASASSGTNSLIVWRVSDGSSRNFGTRTNPVFAVAFTTDGGTLASAERDAIYLWDVASGVLSETNAQETIRVSCLAYSPNANLLIHGREDATLVLSTNTRGAQGQPPLDFQRLTVGLDNTTALEASVEPWSRYVIQASSDLNEWTFLTWTFSRSNLLAIPDLETGTTPARFYRALTPP